MVHSDGFMKKEAVKFQALTLDIIFQFAFLLQKKTDRECLHAIKKLNKNFFRALLVLFKPKITVTWLGTYLKVGWTPPMCYIFGKLMPWAIFWHSF